MNSISQLSLSFWLALVALITFGRRFWRARDEAWGFPALMVLTTIAVWYFGDVFYNNYLDYQVTFGDRILSLAWWEVLLFIVSFGIFARPIHRRINRRVLHRKSSTLEYLGTDRLSSQSVQRRIDKVCFALVLAWLLLYVVALFRVEGDVIGLFAPYLGEKADPWSRARIGTGFDSLISLASNFQIFLAAAFGVLAATARNPRTRIPAFIICALTFPYFIFDRTRNTMLASMLPGLLAWVIFRLRGGVILKLAVLGAAFVIISSWFSFVMSNRSERTIASALRSENDSESAKAGNGLNMFEELAWENAFIVSGIYRPNWGERYLAELANPIPRAIWHGKPLIGIDYSIARGQSVDDSDEQAGVAASISTGMIGQGVVNFGGFFGPIAAAAIISLWVAILARQDLFGNDPGRFLLYGIGMLLTFNMGRDITLLVIYPFLFGFILLWGFNKLARGPKKSAFERGGSSSARVSARP